MPRSAGMHNFNAAFEKVHIFRRGPFPKFAAAYTSLTEAVFGEKRLQCFSLAFGRTCTCGALAWA